MHSEVSALTERLEDINAKIKCQKLANAEIEDHWSAIRARSQN